MIATYAPDKEQESEKSKSWFPPYFFSFHQLDMNSRGASSSSGICFLKIYLKYLLTYRHTEVPVP